MRKIMRDKSGAELAVNKIIVMLLVLTAVALVIFAVVKMGGLDALRNLIPGFGQSNNTNQTNPQPPQKNWTQILNEYKVQKCRIDSHCLGSPLPCQCFSEDEYKNKLPPSVCDAKYSSCMEYDAGCVDTALVNNPLMTFQLTCTNIVIERRFREDPSSLIGINIA